MNSGVGVGEAVGVPRRGGLGIDHARGPVTGEPVDLNVTEYAALYELAVHVPSVLNRSPLLKRVWGWRR